METKFSNRDKIAESSTEDAPRRVAEGFVMEHFLIKYQGRPSHLFNDNFTAFIRKLDGDSYQSLVLLNTSDRKKTFPIILRYGHDYSFQTMTTVIPVAVLDDFSLYHDRGLPFGKEVDILTMVNESKISEDPYRKKIDEPFFGFKNAELLLVPPVEATDRFAASARSRILNLGDGFDGAPFVNDKYNKESGYVVIRYGMVSKLGTPVHLFFEDKKL